MLYTTLAAIRAHAPCESGWKKLLKHLGKKKADDKRLALSVVLKSNGVADALWCLRACDGAEMFARWFALDAAKRVYPIWHARHPNDARVNNCIDVTERFLSGKATKEELRESRSAAAAAADAAAVYAAAYAATAAAADAAADAADAAYADGAAAAAVYAAAAEAAERKWQAKHIAACLRAWPKKPWPRVDAIKTG